MALDPQAKALLDTMPPMPDFSTLDLALIRAGMAQAVARRRRARACGEGREPNDPGPGRRHAGARVHAAG